MQKINSSVPRKKRIVTFLFVTVFLCYFVSESVLRQAAASNVKSKGFNIDKVIVKLPDSIRNDVADRIELARLRDHLKIATKDVDIIITKISIATILGEKEVDQTHSKIIDQFPDSPYAASSYLHFFMAPSTAIRRVTPEQFKSYIGRMPESEKYHLWRSAYFRMQNKNIPAKKILEFFKPILDHPPEYQDYQSLYLDLAELAFQNGLADYEDKARKCEALVADKPTLDSLELPDTTRKKKK